MPLKLSFKNVQDILQDTVQIKTHEQLRQELIAASTSTRLWLIWRRIYVEAGLEEVSLDEMLEKLFPAEDCDLSADQLARVEEMRKAIPKHTKAFETSYPDGTGGIDYTKLVTDTKSGSEPYKEVLRCGAHCGCMFTGSWRFRPAGAFQSIRDFVNNKLPEEVTLNYLPADQAGLIRVYLSDVDAWYKKEKRKGSLAARFGVSV